MSLRLALLTGVALVLASLPVAARQARATGADLRGIIVDDSGARVPSAVVTVVSLATAAVRETITSGIGEFVIPGLDAGEYEVLAGAPGFDQARLAPVRLQVGDVIPLTITLQVGGIDLATIVAEAPIVSPAQASASTVVSARAIEDLPLNGRRFLSLASLAAGVTTSVTSDPSGETSGLSVLGQRPVANTLLIDGFDNNDRILGGGNAAFSQDAIREFQVLTASYPAEFGGATGGVVNIVTRSGTNQWHGSGFGYLRDETLNARGHFERVDPFGDPVSQGKSPFRQAQFGASAGLPLRRDRTFAFAVAERQFVDASQIVTIDPIAALLLRAAGAPVTPGAAPYEQRAWLTSGRVDHFWAPAHNLFVRLHAADDLDENFVPFGGLTDRSRGAVKSRRDWGVGVTQTDVVGFRWLNEARALVTRQRHDALPVDPVGPSITIAGVAAVGRSDTHPTSRRNWTLQLKDTLTLSTDRHTAKVGIDLARVAQEALLSFSFGGAYTFVALPPLPGLPNGLSALEAFAAGLPAFLAQGYGDGTSPFDVTSTSLFAQDDWRLTSRLTVKAGLRYNHQAYPAFDVAVSDVGGTRLSYPFPLGGHTLAPRLAAAYDLTGHDRTSVHGAYGVFFGSQLTSIYGLTNVFGREDGTRLQLYPFPASVAAWQQPGHRLPDGALPAPRVTLTVGPDAGTPRLRQASFGVTHLWTPRLSLALDYVHSRGSHQLGALDYNPLVPALGPGRRPNDVAGVAGTSASVQQLTDFGETWYDGLLTSLTYRLRGGDELKVSYTLSQADDNSSEYTGLVNDNGRGRDPANPTGLPLGFEPDRERGPADTDERHRLVVSGTIRVPAGVSLSGVLAASSGLPYTALAGADLNGDGLPNADRARTSPADASTAVQRNAERLPARTTVDVRVARPWRIGSRIVVTPLLEAFNLFNRTNYSEINNVFGPGRFPIEPLRDERGRITYGRFQQALSPRQIQLAARVAF